MAKVILISRTQPDFNTFLAFARETLNRKVSSLADSKSRPTELQKFALMLSEAIDSEADNSVLDNLGPVLGHISFTFGTVIFDADYADYASTLNCEIIRIPAKTNGYSDLFLTASLKHWREVIIDSLSMNVANYAVKELIAGIYDKIKAEGFNKLWNDVPISKNQHGHLTERS